MKLVDSAARVMTSAVVLTVLAQHANAQMAAGSKIAYIRSQEILQAAPGAATAQMAFQKQVDSIGVIEKAWSDSLQALIVSYGKNESTLTQVQKDAQQKDIRDHQADWKQRDSVMRIELTQSQNQLLGPIMEQINTVIENIRAQDGYAMIFDAQAQGAGIVAADKNLDLTDRVIARLKVLGAPAGMTGKPTTTATKPAVGPVQSPSGLHKSGN